MPQDKESGAKAFQYGFETARMIGERIGVVPTSNTSNEFWYNDRPVAIRCARKQTTSVGMSYKMLESVESIIGAFEQDNGRCELYVITPTQYRDNMTETKSKGDSAGKVGKVNRSYFIKEGVFIGTVEV